ncbi:MAG: hypothetical protein AAGF23_20430, partial [Acidobacteriota bacterium]
MWLAGSLAQHDDFLFIAAPVFEIVWRRTAGDSLARDVLFEHLYDIDIIGNRLIALGAQRSESRELSPDGAIAWILPIKPSSELPEVLGEPKPILYSQFGTGPKAIDACAAFGLGHVRFFDDGRSIIAPGAEPTVYLRDPDGVPIRSWDATGLGLEVPCAELDMEQVLLYSRDPDARWTWLEQFETIDEVLATDHGPVLIGRRVEAGETRWRAIFLDLEGSDHRSVDLPFSTPSRRSHLKADIDGDRMVFLLYEDDRPERPWAAE